MTEHIKACLHCGAPMQVNRSTKKYCSDSCKQAAFYTRAAQVIPLDNNMPKNETATNPLPPAKQPLVIPLSATEPYLQQADTPMNQSYAQQEPDMIPPSPQPNTNDSANVTRPSVNVTPSAVPDMFNVKPNDHEPYAQTQQRYLPATIENKQIEEEAPYEWVHPDFTDEIAAYISEHYHVIEKFQYPQKYWYGYELEDVKWVSVRMRCIIENLLYLDRKTISKKTAVTLINALNDMVASRHYQFLPYNYPLKNELKELQKNVAAMGAIDTASIAFIIKKYRRVRLIAQRFMLADLVPFVRFKELDFSK